MTYFILTAAAIGTLSALTIIAGSFAEMLRR